MKRAMLILLSTTLVLVAAACSPGGSKNVAKPGPRSWIDAPLPDSNLPSGQVLVVSHSSDLAHVAQIELSVNGGVVRADPSSDSAATLVTTTQQWMPPGPGNYTLRVRAQNSAGLWGDYAQVVVTTGGNGGTVQGVVFSDLNGNGLPNDAGDAPLDGVAVTLSGCASKSMTTTVDGAFLFTGLPAGTCVVQVSKPGWNFSGTYPAGIGYPARAASDPLKPTAFSLYLTPVESPTAGATSAPTSTPTAAPSFTPAPTALPAVGIAFYSDQTSLVAGQCTTIHWQVTNASQVFVDNATVPALGSKQDCPTQTTTHTLHVVTLDNQSVDRSITITVVPPTLTPTSPPTSVPPTFTPTPVPSPTTAPTAVGCRGTPVISYFNANPSAIPPGRSSVLSWGPVTNANDVEIDNGIGGVATPGSITVSPRSTTIYTLTAYCGSNKATRQVKVTVARGIIPRPGQATMNWVEMWLQSSRAVTDIIGLGTITELRWTVGEFPGRCDRTSTDRTESREQIRRVLGKTR
jgi:hypothetical protein